MCSSHAKLSRRLIALPLPRGRDKTMHIAITAKMQRNSRGPNKAVSEIQFRLANKRDVPASEAHVHM